MTTLATTCSSAASQYGDACSSLPYTGAELLPILLITLVLILAGLLLKRAIS